MVLGIALDAVQQVAHVGVDCDHALVRQWRIVLDLVYVDLTAPLLVFGRLGLFGALADHVPPLQQDAATNAVRLDPVVERVGVADGRLVGHVKALLLGLEEEAPDLRSAPDDVALGQVLALRAVFRREAKFDEGRGVEPEVLADDRAAQRACVINAREPRGSVLPKSFVLFGEHSIFLVTRLEMRGKKQGVSSVGRPKKTWDAERNGWNAEPAAHYTRSEVVPGEMQPKLDVRRVRWSGDDRPSHIRAHDR